jgi:hypothetical protein
LPQDRQVSESEIESWIEGDVEKLLYLARAPVAFLLGSCCKERCVVEDGKRAMRDGRWKTSVVAWMSDVFKRKGKYIFGDECVDLKALGPKCKGPNGNAL